MFCITCRWEFHALLSGSHRMTGFLMTIGTFTNIHDLNATKITQILEN